MPSASLFNKQTHHLKELLLRPRTALWRSCLPACLHRCSLRGGTATSSIGRGCCAGVQQPAGVAARRYSNLFYRAGLCIIADKQLVEASLRIFRGLGLRAAQGRVLSSQGRLLSEHRTTVGLACAHAIAIAALPTRLAAAAVLPCLGTRHFAARNAVHGA